MLHQRIHAGTRSRRDNEHLGGWERDRSAQPIEVGVRLRQIGFVQHNNLRAARQFGLVQPQLFIDLPIVVDRIAPIDLSFDASGVK